MKIPPLCIAVLLLFSGLSRAQVLVLSKLDTEHAAAREKAYTTWTTEAEAGAIWKKMASTHISIYTVHNDNGVNRDIYIFNPGFAYWVLSDMSLEYFWKWQEARRKAGFELVGATKYKSEKGEDRYWALWTPHDSAAFLKDKMLDLGITPARVDYPAQDSAATPSPAAPTAPAGG